MTPLRVAGLIFLVFVLTLPVTLAMNRGLSWTGALPDVADEQDTDDPVADLQCLAGLEAAGDGDYDKAIACYTEAIKRDPRYSYAYLGRGDVYAAKGDTDRALQDYDQALRLDPDNVAAKMRAAAVRAEKTHR
jgi:tetratricopeptide (TPR) repeat protein